MIGVCWELVLPAVAAAAPPRMIATPKAIANAAFAARRVCLRIMLPSDCRFPDSGTLPTGYRLAGLGDERGVRDVAAAQRLRGDEPLDQGDETVAREGQQADEHRRADHALDPVARLVDDHVAEA